MRHFSPYIGILFGLFGLGGPLHAQDAQPAGEAGIQEAESAAEPQLYEFETAGFSIDVMALYEPVIRETSDASVYAMTFQRRAADGGAFDTDGKMAFMRLTQTIAPLAESGTLEGVMDSTVRNAVQSLDNAYGKRRDRLFTDCTLEILGELREGKRIDAGIMPDGSVAYVECYAFEDKHGNGIGVTIKLREPADQEIPEDVLLAEELLVGLEIKDLEPETQYYFSFSGYPLRLPVGSSIQNLRQVNDFVFEATISLEGASARVQLIKAPAEYNLKKTASDQLSGYANTLEQQAQQGQLILKRAERSFIPAGENGNAVLEGMSFALNSGNIDFYNTMHTAIDRGVIVVASFTGAESDADTVTRYLADFFARPLGSIDQSTLECAFDGYEIELPAGLLFVHNEREQGEYLISPERNRSWQQFVEAPLTGHSGHTRIAVVQSDHAVALAATHRTLCEAELNRLRGSDTPAASLESAPVESTLTLEDGRTVDTLTSSLTPAVSAENLEERGVASAQELKITSYLVPTDAGQHAVVVSTVASTSMHAEADLFTRLIVDRIETMETAGRIPLSFGHVSLPSNGASAKQVASNDYEGFEEDLRLTLGADTVAIRTTRDDPRHEVLSSRRLSEEYLKTVWHASTRADERDLYPEDSAELGSIEFAGYPAVMFQAQLGVDEATDADRTEPAFLRVIGFIHGKQYTTVAIEQDGEKDPDRLDWIMGLFQAADNGDAGG